MDKMTGTLSVPLR